MNILNKISLKNLKINKKRTIATAMGIILATALMIGIGLIFSTIKETMIREVINSNGSYHAVFTSLNENQKKQLIKNNTIKKYQISTFEQTEIVKKDYPVYKFGLDENLKAEIKLKSGRLYKTESEIVISESLASSLDYKLNDKITLNEKEYTIVGTALALPQMSNYMDFIYTNLDGDIVSVYVEYNSVKNVREKTKVLAESLNMNYEDQIAYNTALLELSGESQYVNFDAVAASLMSIALSVLSIGCIIVIYNSFAISIVERKRQFGLLNSIGATKKQIKKSVYFESLIIGTIGIVLGIVGAFIGIGIVVLIANHLLDGIITTKFQFVAHPIYIIIPILFMILVIIASSVIPALLASRLSPIDNIKMKDDIKIKAKKLKVNSLIQKIFGFEATIAFKNMKRNKRKYRITILALFVSISMFIIFSSYMEYLLKSEDMMGINNKYDMVISYYSSDKYDEFLNNLKTYETKELVVTNVLEYTFKTNATTYSDKFKNDFNFENEDPSFSILSIDSDSYKELLKKYNKKTDTVFVYNYYESMIEKDNNLNLVSGKIVNETKDLKANLYDETYYKNPFSLNFNNVEYINEKLPYLNSTFGIFIIVPQNDLDKIANKINELETVDNYVETSYVSHNIYINAEDHEQITNDLNDIKPSFNSNYYVMNYRMEMALIAKVMLLAKILLYGFVSLVAAIGVTSVFNTLNTSIILRKREFAMLRSVGLSPEGFNKMILFETLIFSFKSLLYSIPFSLLIVKLIHNSMNDIIDSSMLIPYKAIIISTVMVLLIVFITIQFSSKTIKKANILESLRDENI